MNINDEKIQVQNLLSKDFGEFRESLAEDYCNYAHYLEEEGRCEEAKEYYEKGIHLYERLSENTRSNELKMKVADNYYRYGNLFYVLEENTCAFDCLKKTERLLCDLLNSEKLVNVRRQLSRTMLSMTILLIGENDISKAEEYMIKAFELHKDIADETNSPEDKEELALCAMNDVANFYRMKEDYDNTKKYLMISLGIFKDLDKLDGMDKDNLILVYVNLGRVLQKLNSADDARECYKSAIEIADVIEGEIDEDTQEYLDDIRNEMNNI